MADDERVPFAEAVQTFREFLRSQGWPAEILWLTRNRVVGRRRTYWVFRPEELTSDAATRTFYDAVRRTDSSIRLDAVGQLLGRSLACVVDFGGPSRMLNFGLLPEPWDLRPVLSRGAWVVIQTASRLWNDTPSLRASRITGTAASTEELGAAAYDFYQRGVRRWLG